MVKDSKMTDKTTGKEGKKEESKKEEEAVTPPPPMPPLEASSRRLERLLGGGLSDKDRQLHTYTNPGKVVRRWLGTASGASGNATFQDISAAACTLLDPEGPCAAGRQLLVKTESSTEEKMDVDGSEEKKQDLGYLTMASAREVESWLISLSVRLLWKEEKYSQAFELIQKGIAILLEHLHVASTNIRSLSGVSTGSLFPPLARMYRYRSLVADALKDPTMDASLRQDMAKAHNMACLRRDVDSQATLLNLMLRDLLLHDQGKFVVVDVKKRTSKCRASNLTHPPLFAPSQLNKHTSCFPIPPFPSRPPTTSSAVICITAVVSKPCDWNTQRPFPISVNVCASLPPTLDLAFALRPSGC
jgi:hypothetical protein